MCVFAVAPFRPCVPRADKFVQTVYAAIGALIFSLYLMYDIQVSE